MLYAIKIIMCVVVGAIGFISFLKRDSLKELKTQATPEQKKDIEYIDMVAFLSPLVIMTLIMCL